jgi:hypothetical protein
MSLQHASDNLREQTAVQLASAYAAELGNFADLRTVMCPAFGKSEAA